jgi:hypothetical protein
MLDSHREEGSLDLERILADLKQERDRLDGAIAALEGANLPRTSRMKRGTRTSPPTAKARRGGGLTPEGRRRLSLAMKKRWAERKKKDS